VYTGRKHARVQGAQPYTAMFGSWTDHVHGLCTAVYTDRKNGRVHGTRPCTRRVHGRVRVIDGPCTWPVHGRVQSVQPWSCTLYMGGPCTRAVNTAVYRVYDSVHGRVPCTRSCNLYTAVFAAVYTAVHGVYGPCTPQHSAYQASQKLTAETCWRAITQIQ